MTYEGWANYQTWNVSLWINNEQPIYNEARHFMSAYMNRGVVTYAHFVDDILLEAFGRVTPDGVSWTDPTLDHDALTSMLKEMVD